MDRPSNQYKYHSAEVCEYVVLSIAPRVFNINFENKTGQGSKEYKHVCEAMRERERERERE